MNAGFSQASSTLTAGLTAAQAELQEVLEQELLALFVKLLSLPTPAQKMLGQLIVQFSQRLRDMHSIHFNLRSAGAERLMIYLKVQAVWPEVANSATLGKAFKSTLLLDTMAQSALCFKVGETINMVALYIDLCHKKKTTPKTDQMESLVMSCLMQGGQDCRHIAKFMFKPH
jgi:hypothetical protein